MKYGTVALLAAMLVVGASSVADAAWVSDFESIAPTGDWWPTGDEGWNRYELPSGWGTSGANVVVGTDVAHGGSNSIGMLRGAGEASPLPVWSMTLDALNNTLGYWVYWDALTYGDNKTVGGDWEVRKTGAYIGTGDPLFAVRTQPGHGQGDIFVNNVAGIVPSGTLQTGVWYNVEYVFDFDDQTVDVTVSDGTGIVGSAADLALSASLSPGEAGTFSAYYNGTGDLTAPPMWFDDFYVNEIPEPATLGLLAVGGLLMLRRRG